MIEARHSARPPSCPQDRRR